MKIPIKSLIVCLGISLCTAAHSQAIFSEKLYGTGEALQKPMVMTPFVEFKHARKMPDLQLEMLDGKKTSLNQYKGKLLILNIWASWCAPCIREIPELTKLQKVLKDSKTVILGVSVDSNLKQLKSFMKKYKAEDFHTLLDKNISVQAAMPLEVVPTNLIIDGNGNMVGYLPGYLPWDDEDILPFLKKLENKYSGTSTQDKK